MRCAGSEAEARGPHRFRTDYHVRGRPEAPKTTRIRRDAPGGSASKSVRAQRRRMARWTLRILAPCGIGPFGIALPRLASADSRFSSEST